MEELGRAACLTPRFAAVSARQAQAALRSPGSGRAAAAGVAALRGISSPGTSFGRSRRAPPTVPEPPDGETAAWALLGYVLPGANAWPGFHSVSKQRYVPLHCFHSWPAPRPSSGNDKPGERRTNDASSRRARRPCLIVRMGVQHQSICRLLADDRRSAPIRGGVKHYWPDRQDVSRRLVATVAHSCIDEPTTVWRTPANPYCVIQLRSRSNLPSIPRRQLAAARSRVFAAPPHGS